MKKKPDHQSHKQVTGAEFQNFQNPSLNASISKPFLAGVDMHRLILKLFETANYKQLSQDVSSLLQTTPTQRSTSFPPLSV